MTPNEYAAGKDRIAAEYKSATAACGALKANAKDVCVAEAKADAKAAMKPAAASTPAEAKSTVSTSRSREGAAHQFKSRRSK